HIRAFAAFASVTTVVCIAQGMYINPIFWIVLRLIMGYCIAGLYIVIESWLLAGTTLSTRGKVLAIYMMALYSGQGLGQFLLDLSDPHTLIPFCFVAILTALSVVPVTSTYEKSPELDDHERLNFFKLYQLSPSGVMGCFCSGLILGAVYGLLPFFVKQIGYGLSDIALIMGLAIFGGMILQYPIGHLSDIFSRRRVLLSIVIATLGMSIAIILLDSYRWFLFIGIFIFGGLTFTLYPLCISLACDHIDGEDFVSAAGGLLLSYGVGATIGPMIAPAFINQLGPKGLFIYFVLVCVFLAGFISWRSKTNAPVPLDEQQQYVAVPRSSAVATEMDPRLEELEANQENDT
ncbi:MAG: MFS transporter, partial [Legionellales bacterium]|nr:MFS transporter [Legionellales bacterium]